MRTSSPVSNATVRLAFVPSLNAARQIGFGVQSASSHAATAALAEASQVAYYLELIPDGTLPPDQPIETTVEVSDAIPTSLYLPLLTR